MQTRNELYKALNDIGLIPAHRWPVPDADLHRELERIQGDMSERAMDAARVESGGSYDDGLEDGEQGAADELAEALGVDDHFDNLIVKVRELVKSQKAAE